MPTGKALRCLRSSCGFESRPPRHQFVVEHEFSSALSLKQVIAGSLACPRRHGVKLDWRTEGGLSSHYRPVRFRQALPSSTAVPLVEVDLPLKQALPSSTAVPLVEVDLPLKQDVASSSLAGGTRMLGDRLTGKAADC